MGILANKTKNMKRNTEMTKKNTVEYLQMDLIPPSEVESLSKSVEEIRESCDKVRKGMFKRHSELEKRIEAIECQINALSKKLEKILVMFAQIAQSEQEEDGQKDMSQPVTQIYVMSVDASQVFAVPEIGVGQIMGKSA